MFFRLSSLVLCVVAAFVVGTYAQSSTPGCFTCPPTDQLGFALGNSDTTTDPIFCSYPAVPGEDPNDFFCTYSATTGALVTDNDAGLCEPTAVNTCNRRKRAALPRSPRSAQQARSPKPATMQTRSRLKKRRTDDQARSAIA